VTPFTPSLKQWTIIGTLLVPPWSIFILSCYWLFFDAGPPVLLQYQAEKFTSDRAYTRDDAIRLAVDEAHSGADVYIYRELCASRHIVGEARPVWVTQGIQWSASQRTAVSDEGCTGRSYQVEVPTTPIPREFSYHMTMVYRNNPLTQTEVTYPTVRLLVRSSAKITTP
jgi:hypothetical protein